MILRDKGDLRGQRWYDITERNGLRLFFSCLPLSTEGAILSTANQPSTLQGVCLEKAVISPFQPICQHLLSPVGMATDSFGWCHAISCRGIGAHDSDRTVAVHSPWVYNKKLHSPEPPAPHFLTSSGSMHHFFCFQSGLVFRLHSPAWRQPSPYRLSALPASPGPWSSQCEPRKARNNWKDWQETRVSKTHWVLKTGTLQTPQLTTFVSRKHSKIALIGHTHVFQNTNICTHIHTSATPRKQFTC